jgi:hypothetical protein
MNALVDSKTAWEEYCKSEIAVLTPIVQSHGITLDEVQPHISGERFLMQAVTTSSGKKLILLGKQADGSKVVIKAANDAAGIKELEHERSCRLILQKLDFAGEVFHTPKEITHLRKNGYVINVQRFIDQKCSFLDRPQAEQFSLALRAFKGQESAHATTYKHRKLIAKVFDIRDKNIYLKMFSQFKEQITSAMNNDTQISSALNEAENTLRSNELIIEQYSGFLTHTDFVPHNIRISQDGTIFLLDHSSLTFGNKYEGWARFINFMTLYNPPLQKALEKYVRENRTQEELISLRMMRIYRLGEIIYYYVRTLPKSSGDLLLLNTARIHFWKDVLSNVQKQKEIPQNVIDSYIKMRDSLRSEEEKRRQSGLH